MGRSKALFAASKKVIVGGVNSPVRAFRSVGGDPLFMRSARGAHIQDADGKDYVDYVLSWGPMILGHAHPSVVRAAQRALRKGSSYGAPTEEELRLGTAIRDALPSMERLRFVSSGTEAVMSALRRARAYTGRGLVVKFVGGYHGHVDSLLVAAGSGAATLGRPDSAGVPAAWAKTTLCLSYNDIPAVRRAFREHISPRASSNRSRPTWPWWPPFLETLGLPRKQGPPHSTRSSPASGSSTAAPRPGCASRPSTSSARRAAASVGYCGGRRETGLVAPLGPVCAGTLSGNRWRWRPAWHPRRFAPREALRPHGRASRVLVTELRGWRASGPALQVNHVASMLTVFSTETPVRDFATAKTSDAKTYAKFFHALLGRGVYFPPAQFEAAMLSGAHTAADLERTLDAAARAFRRL